MVKVVGLAGGSGAGKSSICETLADRFPDKYTILGLDNYQKIQKGPDFPYVDDMPNWDHPDVVDWEKLRADITALRSGQAVTALVWRHRLNPDFHIHKQFKEITLEPKPVILVEGHLALHHKIIDLYDMTIYLDTDEAVRNAYRAGAPNRQKFIGATERYMTEVLAPMHAKYVEPTKTVADTVIDMTRKTINQGVAAVHDSVNR